MRSGMRRGSGIGSGSGKDDSCAIVDLALGRTVISGATVASTFWTRFVGLMGRKSLPFEEALLLLDCGSVHTFFMKFPIDVAYLDRDLVVTSIHCGVPPWRVLLGAKGGVHTLEMASGAFASIDLAVGHRLELRPQSHPRGQATAG